MDKSLLIRDVCRIIDITLNEETQGTLWFSPSAHHDKSFWTTLITFSFCHQIVSAWCGRCIPSNNRDHKSNPVFPTAPAESTGEYEPWNALQTKHKSKINPTDSKPQIPEEVTVEKSVLSVEHISNLKNESIQPDGKKNTLLPERKKILSFKRPNQDQAKWTCFVEA